MLSFLHDQLFTTDESCSMYTTTPQLVDIHIHIKYSITTLKNILAYSNLLFKGFDTVSNGKIISVSLHNFAY